MSTQKKRFEECSKLFDRANILKAQLSGPFGMKRRDLLAEVKSREAEARRLEKIARIMRNSNDVQSKYDRAVRLYKESFKRFKAVDIPFKRAEGILGAAANRLNTYCKGNWDTALAVGMCAGRQHGRS